MVLFEKPTHADLRATTEVDEQLWLEGLMVGFQARISSSLNSPFLEQPFARFHAREKPTLRRQKFCQTMTWQSLTML